MPKVTAPDPSELNLHEYFEGSTDLYCVLDLKGCFIHVNPAWKKTLGYEASELVGRSYTEFVHPCDLAVSKEKFGDPNPPDRGRFKNRYRHKNGHHLTLLWSGHQDNIRTRVYAHARDASNEAQSASLLFGVAAIQEAYFKYKNQPQEFFKRTLHALITAADVEGGFLAERHGHVALENSEGSNVDALVKSTLARNSVWKSESTLCIPLSYLGDTVAVLGFSSESRSIDARALLETLKPVLEAASSVIGLQRASRRELELQERFLVIVENLPLMLTEFGPDGRVTWANRYYRDKIGWTEADILLKDVVKHTVGTPEGDAREPERAREFMLSGRSDWQSFTLKDRDGEWFQSTWTNVRLSDGRAIGIGQDLTDRQAAESKMIQSSKMASLGEMSAGVSHEINNPLTIIQGSAFRAIQNLSDIASTKGTAAMDEVEGDLNRIIQNCDRIARIVRGLRAFSRTDEHEPLMPTQLASIVDDVLNLAAERFRSHAIDLSVNVDTQITIDCRPVLLGQVLMNLLNNAFDAVADSRRIPKAVKIKAKALDDQVEISVEDNGPGISSSIHSRVLDPFFTTKEVGKGTGLGLSISKGIVESHSGKLSFTTSDAGTVFVVRLPVRQGIDASL